MQWTLVRNIGVESQQKKLLRAKNRQKEKEKECRSEITQSMVFHQGKGGEKRAVSD